MHWSRCVPTNVLYSDSRIRDVQNVSLFDQKDPPTLEGHWNRIESVYVLEILFGLRNLEHLASIRFKALYFACTSSRDHGSMFVLNCNMIWFQFNPARFVREIGIMWSKQRTSNETVGFLCVPPRSHALQRFEIQRLCQKDSPTLVGYRNWTN